MPKPPLSLPSHSLVCNDSSGVGRAIFGPLVFINFSIRVSYIELQNTYVCVPLHACLRLRYSGNEENLSEHSDINTGQEDGFWWTRVGRILVNCETGWNEHYYTVCVVTG